LGDHTQRCGLNVAEIARLGRDFVDFNGCELGVGAGFGVAVDLVAGLVAGDVFGD